MRLSIKNLTGQAGWNKLFTSLNVTVKAGELCLVCGINGSGKSTLLRIIAGLARPTVGTVTLTIDETEQSCARYCHYLSPLNAMKGSLSVHDNLAFWQRFYGGSLSAITPALKAVALEHLNDLPFSYLSTGQRRRIALARLLLTARPIWLLDEPTLGLDHQSTDIYSRLIADHLADEGIVIVASHAPLGMQSHCQLTLGRK